MNEDESRGPSVRAADLRKQAEAKAARSTENIEHLSPAAVRLTFHELRVHQIELEMQNEELRRAQQELDAVRERYFDLYNLAPVGYVTLSEEGLVLNANSTAGSLLGVVRSKLIGQLITRFILPADQDIYYRCRKELLEAASAPPGLAGTAKVCEFRMRRPDAAPVWVRMEASVSWDAQGMSVCRAVLSDITSRKQAEEAMATATLAAESASRAKSNFIANMSHELRTPLNAIIGFSEALTDKTSGELNARQAKYVENVLAAGRHLLNLINDVLDLSKVEAGKVAFDPEPVRIRGTLEAALALMKDQAVRQGLTLTLDAPENLLARADERLLKQILINLLSNAVKFTPAGGRIDVKAEPCGLDIRVSITDSGIGIRPEDQGRIFLEFEQVEAGHDRSRQGSGLGLPLVKCHVELHGGRVWVESGGEGKGSTFRFTLPAEMAGV